VSRYVSALITSKGAFFPLLGKGTVEKRGAGTRNVESFEGAVVDAGTNFQFWRRNVSAPSECHGTRPLLPLKQVMGLRILVARPCFSLMIPESIANINEMEPRAVPSVLQVVDTDRFCDASYFGTGTCCFKSDRRTFHRGTHHGTCSRFGYSCTGPKQGIAKSRVTKRVRQSNFLTEILPIDTV
jgi:hypothetical protein